ncbi:MAG: metalloprotease PmbA [Betaproteobacteria bacterium]|nr:metalloprotease PmbA [Betaproteobacteria bacterium]MDH4324153.1 metalloprotease PmbA [Betaproteobacteria bacterium]MDH5579102.1 metalloprotease PmbA [Betaproteobacteria bacterium]
MKNGGRFTYTHEQLKELAAQVLAQARRLGASACECDVSEGQGLSVTVRKGAVETLEHNRDKSIGVTVYLGERPAARRGHASTSDFSAAALAQTVEAALAIARHTAVDDCAGLPEPELLARDIPDLDLYHPWDIGTEEAIGIAQRCEAAAFALSPKIRNSEGASVSAQHAQFVFANSLGFMAGFPTSRHSLYAALIAEDARGMQRDDWYSAARVPATLADPEALGRYAGERALARLGARRLGTRQAPVLFEAPLASQLLGSFVSAASGGNLYRKATFLAGSLGQAVFAPGVTVEERPLEPRALASSPFDDEGVATHPRTVVRGGVLEGYFLGCYAARKLGMKSTGSAGGNHNLELVPDGPDFRGMLARMHRGLLVTELLGHGVNLVTGDYSRGAAGYWVENGAIAHPVEEITIAGNLRDMFRSIAGVGSDIVVRGSRRSGSVLVQNMTIAGE